MKTKIEKMIEIGGKEWKKDDKHRIYFNESVLAKLIELDCNRYNTGNISSATLNGESISNNEAGKIYSSLSISNFYYDVRAEKYYSRGLGELFQEIVNIIKEKIN